MAAAQRLYGHSRRSHSHLLSSQKPTYSHGETSGSSSGTAVLGAEFCVFGERVCELCENGDEVWEKEGVGAEWVEDAGGEFFLSCCLDGHGLGLEADDERTGLYGRGMCYCCRLCPVTFYECEAAKMRGTQS